MRQITLPYLIDELNLEINMAAEDWNPPWPEGFLAFAKNIRDQQELGLRETLDFISNSFGIEIDQTWRSLRIFLTVNQINLDQIRGPHAMTLMKAIKAKYTNVSTGQ